MALIIGYAPKEEKITQGRYKPPRKGELNVKLQLEFNEQGGEESAKK